MNARVLLCYCKYLDSLGDKRLYRFESKIVFLFLGRNSNVPRRRRFPSLKIYARVGSIHVRKNNDPSSTGILQQTRILACTLKTNKKCKKKKPKIIQEKTCQFNQTRVC